VSGEGLALGYWNAPDRTSAVFREPAAGARRHFLTGDRGRWLPDGQLEHQGRIDRQVQVRGFRVELAEIENALLQLDMIADAAVVAPASKTDVRVVAHVVPTSGRIDRTELHALLSTTLPASMLPHHYVVHESLPRTSTGKVDRIALATVVPEAGAGRGDGASTPGAVPPGRGNEKSVSVIVAVCAQVLGVESIREDDNFFLLGGDSLQAMQVASRLAVRLRADVRVRDFLEAPTPRQLAERLASAGRAMPEPAAPDERLQALLSEIETLPLDEVRRRLGA
jgi:acyl carrier protein